MLPSCHANNFLVVFFGWQILSKIGVGFFLKKLWWKNNHNVGFCETQTQAFMSKYGEKNGKCSDAQGCALWKIFASAGGPIFPTFWLPSPRNPLKYPMTPAPGFPHEEPIVHGRIYFSIFWPDMLFSHGNSETWTWELRNVIRSLHQLCLWLL